MIAGPGRGEEVRQWLQEHREVAHFCSLLLTFVHFCSLLLTFADFCFCFFIIIITTITMMVLMMINKKVTKFIILDDEHKESFESSLFRDRKPPHNSQANSS